MKMKNGKACQGVVEVNANRHKAPGQITTRKGKGARVGEGHGGGEGWGKVGVRHAVVRANQHAVAGGGVGHVPVQVLSRCGERGKGTRGRVGHGAGIQACWGGSMAGNGRKHMQAWGMLHRTKLNQTKSKPKRPNMKIK